MDALHYLTVQDMLWINLQVAKKVNQFHYATLEEATYYQYSYGESKDVSSQATRFLNGFLKLKPFSELNEATGLVGALAFLHVNGCYLDMEHCSMETLLTKTGEFADRIRVAEQDDHGHKPNVRATIESVLRNYPVTTSSVA